MSTKGLVYEYRSTVGGAAMTVSTGPALFGGVWVNGSAGSCTLTVLDGVATLLATSAGADGLIVIPLAVPIAATNQLLVTASGTGYYTVFFIDKHK